MSYTDKTRQTGEQVLCVTHPHWIIYWHALLLWSLAAGVATGAYLSPIGLNRFVWVVVSALAIRGLVYALVAAYKRYLVEISVTNRRLVYKTGFIWRKTAEMFIPKIESMEVEQSVLGRILGYGSIHCHGDGENIEHLHYIADPLAVQAAINSK